MIEKKFKAIYSQCYMENKEFLTFLLWNEANIPYNGN